MIIKLSLIFEFGLLALFMSCENRSKYEVLISITDKVNKSMPYYTQDSAIRIDSLIPIPEDTIVYECTMFNVDKQTIGILKKTTELIMIEKVKTSPSFKEVRKDNISLVYRYRDVNRALLFAIYVTPDKYRK